MVDGFCNQMSDSDSIAWTAMLMSVVYLLGLVFVCRYNLICCLSSVIGVIGMRT